MLTAQPEHPLTFLQKISSDPKAKLKITPEQLSQLLSQIHLIEKMHDKGLLIIVVSELINYQYSAFYIKLKNVHGDICKVHKPERKRKDGGNRVAPKRHRRNKNNRQDIDI